MSDLNTHHLWRTYQEYYGEEENLKKFDRIFEDKRILVPKTQEAEDDRETQVIKANQRFKWIFTESKKIFPANEILSDLSLFFHLGSRTFLYDDGISTKFVVATQLYYKTIENLGTEIHNDWKKRCEDMTDIGCFGLTELAHGSNARGILTTATYDKEKKEFVINTPCDEAMKFWIGGAAKTSNTAAIFA